MSLMKALTAAGVALVLSTAASLAQTPNRINQFNDWGTYSYQADGNRVCYALSTPTAMQPSSVNHGDIFFLVSQKPGTSAFEPQVVMGYPLRDGSQVTVNVDGRAFTMFTRGESAWVEDASQEPALVSAMRAGRSMTVSAVSARGTNTSYTYSLAGITAAVNSIGSCN
jgi:hypothetical protein